MSDKLPTTSVAQHLAGRIVALKSAALPQGVKQKCEDLLIDVVGLCVTARNEDYIKSALAGLDDDGPCTAIVIQACERAFDVILVARGDARADHIDQQILAFLLDALRQRGGFQRNNAPGQMLRNRCRG